MTTATSPRRTRGIARLPDPRVWGTLVGAAGAAVFVWSNSGVLPGPAVLAARVLWALGTALYVVQVYLRPRVFPPAEALPRRAGLIYLASVAGMLLVIRVGSTFLPEAQRSDLRPALIVVAVGAHFVPFAHAFRAPFFRGLGWAMVVIGAVGLLLGIAWDPRVAAAAAVLAGLVMLGAISFDARSAPPNG